MGRTEESSEDAYTELVYIAGRLHQALQVESLLSSHGIGYVVQTGTYRSGFLFHTEKVGAFFYVVPDLAPQCRDLLERNGYRACAASNRV